MEQGMIILTSIIAFSAVVQLVASWWIANSSQTSAEAADRAATASEISAKSAMLAQCASCIDSLNNFIYDWGEREPVDQKKLQSVLTHILLLFGDDKEVMEWQLSSDNLRMALSFMSEGKAGRTEIGQKLASVVITDVEEEKITGNKVRQTLLHHLKHLQGQMVSNSTPSNL